jgi:hypothetical protein
MNFSVIIILERRYRKIKTFLPIILVILSYLEIEKIANLHGMPIGDIEFDAER